MYFGSLLIFYGLLTFLFGDWVILRVFFKYFDLYGKVFSEKFTWFWPFTLYYAIKSVQFHFCVNQETSEVRLTSWVKTSLNLVLGFHLKTSSSQYIQKVCIQYFINYEIAWYSLVSFLIQYSSYIRFFLLNHQGESVSI